jgi:hypothetical protein
MRFAKLLLLFFLVLSNIAFSQIHTKDDDLTFDTYLERANKHFKKSTDNYVVTFDWDTETIKFKSANCEIVGDINQPFRFTYQQRNNKVYKFVLAIDYQKSADIEKKCGGKTTSANEDIEILFDVRNPCRYATSVLSNLQYLFKRGKNDFNSVSGSMSHSKFDRSIEENEVKWDKMVVDYKTTMQLVLTEMQNDFSKVNFIELGVRDSSTVEYEVPSFNFPYCKYYSCTRQVGQYYCS